MLDMDLIALCVLKEAGAEIDDGKAAVARVIKNRMARKYESDGTAFGTVLKYDQFSWVWFSFGGDRPGYHRVAWTVDEAAAIAAKNLASAPPAALAHCRDIASQVLSGTYRGPLYDHLTDDAVLYLNPRILASIPSWASRDKLVCSIEHHDFYRA